MAPAKEQNMQCEVPLVLEGMVWADSVGVPSAALTMRLGADSSSESESESGSESM